eukprot:TRINITY_DN807_c0_g1_i1.p1 TRINITY_DN807_c0_g1~~TRINITY_DN807_c0_g1_i1.p1  ORF type:complete len:262 (+),score=161.89 TRINITY_DN807_c0_g1_i1:79-864(+)
MFEAKLQQASLLKKILESIKDLVNDANFDCSSEGIALQSMDSSHVSLVAMLLRSQGFVEYRCDRNIALGINLGSMSKILKCAGNDDSVTIKADDEGDKVTFIFENPKGDKVSTFELKLIEIDSETLSIPETDYKAVVSVPASDFQKVCRDLTILGDTVSISCTKGSIRFSVSGDLGSGNTELRQTTDIDSKPEETVTISLEEPVNLSFALRYLNFFTKATGLANTVTLSISPDIPVMLEYPMTDLGYVRYYLAPKIDEEEN